MNVNADESAGAQQVRATAHSNCATLTENGEGDLDISSLANLISSINCGFVHILVPYASYLSKPAVESA